MASNSFGTVFRITTWGESHGPAMGVVIDGCPAGVAITVEDIYQALQARAPGRNQLTSPRKEADYPEILSGVFEGQTTGAPIAIMIKNKDADSKAYEGIKEVLRPGHANFTYLQKYGVFDYRGGGRASARETACRVAAAAVARKVLEHASIDCGAYLHAVGPVSMRELPSLDADLAGRIEQDPLFCPDPAVSQHMASSLEAVKSTGDSLGGVVCFYAAGLPVGLGDPVYEKLEANLAKAMLSIPASKGFEVGEGFAAATMRGSEHNDAFIATEGQVTSSNHAGGTLGGISTGMPLVGRVAFKPTSSIKKPQETVNLQGQAQPFELGKQARHDPCVAVRAVPVVRAMCELVLVDAYLMARCAQL